MNQHDATTPPAGTGDELDRGTGSQTSGGGLGKSTGLYDDQVARKNLEVNEIGDVDDTKPHVRVEKKTTIVDDELARPEEDRSPLT